MKLLGREARCTTRGEGKIVILHNEDYQFRQAVPFVRIDEYHSDPANFRTRDSWRHSWHQGWQRAQGSQAGQLAEYKISMLHFDDEGALLSCTIQSNNGRALWTEEIQCHYQDGLLRKRVFTARSEGRNIHREENRIYDEKRLLIEKNFIDGDSLKQRTRYSYNETGLLLRKEDFRQIKTYSYDERGLCREEKTFSDNEHSSSLLYHYCDNGNIAELWEESPAGQTCRLHKYSYNQHQLLANYQLVNQDGLVLSDLEYKYSNYIQDDWLERYTWRVSGRGGKLSHHQTQICRRSPCLERAGSKEMEQYLQHSRQSLELPEGSYHGQARLGMMHGYGRLDFFDGSCYVGRFDAGRMEGYGSFYWTDGRVYQGYFRDNKMEGKGNYYLADGSLYQGNFAEGRLLSTETYYYLSIDARLSRQSIGSRQSGTLPTAETAQTGEATAGSSELSVTPEDSAEQWKQYQNENPDHQASAGTDTAGLGRRMGTLSEQEFIETAAKAVQQKFQRQSRHRQPPGVDIAQQTVPLTQRTAESRQAGVVRLQQAKQLDFWQQQLAWAKARGQRAFQAASLTSELSQQAGQSEIAAKDLLPEVCEENGAVGLPQEAQMDETTRLGGAADPTSVAANTAVAKAVANSATERSGAANTGPDFYRIASPVMHLEASVDELNFLWGEEAEHDWGSSPELSTNQNLFTGDESERPEIRSATTQPGAGTETGTEKSAVSGVPGVGHSRFRETVTGLQEQTQVSPQSVAVQAQVPGLPPPPGENYHDLFIKQQLQQEMQRQWEEQRPHLFIEQSEPVAPPPLCDAERSGDSKDNADNRRENSEPL